MEIKPCGGSRSLDIGTPVESACLRRTFPPPTMKPGEPAFHGDRVGEARRDTGTGAAGF
jgi:hypothetical protein